MLENTHWEADLLLESVSDVWGGTKSMNTSYFPPTFSDNHNFEWTCSVPYACKHQQSSTVLLLTFLCWTLGVESRTSSQYINCYCMVLYACDMHSITLVVSYITIRDHPAI